MFRTLLVLFTLAFAGTAVAEDLGPYWAATATVGTSANCIPKIFNSSTPVCALFPAGDRTNFRTMRVSADKLARCCWVGKAPTSISADLYITDSAGPNGSGNGACFHLQDSTRVITGRPNRYYMIANTSSGLRDGVCSTSVTQSGDTLYAPCNADADCTNYGGGTCTAKASVSGTQAIGAGMFLMCAGASTPAITVTKMRITP